MNYRLYALIGLMVCLLSGCSHDPLVTDIDNQDIDTGNQKETVLAEENIPEEPSEDLVKESEEVAQEEIQGIKEVYTSMEDLKGLYNQGQVNRGNGQRLQAVMEKAEKGDPITVGFLGGSITQGCHSTVAEKSYAALVNRWFVDTFPDSQVTYVNAGIGGTDSFYGVHRMAKDLLVAKPDVVFVEYSVNDLGLSGAATYFEGILVRLLSQEQEPAVVVINTMYYDSGNNMQGVHNPVALTYDLPIVSIRDGLWPAIEAGSLEASLLTGDMLHPNDMGHAYMAGMITTLLDQHLAEYAAGERVEYGLVLPDTIPYLNGQLLTGDDLEPITMTGWTADTRKADYLGDLFKNGWEITSTTGDIVFKITGSRIAIQYKRYINDLGGQVTVYVDDLEATMTLDGDFVNGWGDTVAADKVIQGTEPKEHTIRIHMDETDNRSFYITAFYVD